MNFAHFIVDMQEVEAENFLPEDWKALANKICSGRQVLGDLGVPSVHVGMTRVTTVVGAFDFVRPLVVLFAGTDVGMDFHQRFAMPVAGDDLVAFKDKVSARTSFIDAYLTQNRIDTVILSGVWECEGNKDRQACLSQSALSFAKDYRTIIAADCTNYDNDNRAALVLRRRLAPEKRIEALHNLGIEAMPMRDIVQLVRSRRPVPFAAAAC